MSSPLLLKLMTYSYCRYQEQNTLIKDCLGALTSKLTTLDSRVGEHLVEISEVLSLEADSGDREMSVIMEEETERSVGEGAGYQHWMAGVKQAFNGQLTRLAKVEGSLEKLVQIYKGELLDMSKQMTKWEEKNQEIKRQLRKCEAQNIKLEEENSELKDQITAQAAQMFIAADVGSVFQAREAAARLSQKGAEIKKRSQTKQKQTQLKSKTNQPSRRQQKQADEDMQKWKKLSKKIQELKSKITIYQEQIHEKDELIKKLKSQRKRQQNNEDSEKRRLKTANTTLRGEKTVLQNQLSVMKKSLAEKTQLCNIQQTELQQLKVKVQGFTDTIKWQTQTIDELRQTITRSQGRTSEESRSKILQLTLANEQLMSFLNEQQKQMKLMDIKTKEIEEIVSEKIDHYLGRMAELEMIVEEKNQCIVKMKTQANQPSQNCSPNLTAQYANTSSSYLQELVKILTKKVADRDELIRRYQIRQ